MTSAQIIVMDDVFNEIRNEGLKFKGKALYAFTKNISGLRGLTMQIQSQRADIFRKHGEVDAETNEFKIKPEEQPQFEQEIQEFANEIHMVDLHQIPIWQMDEYNLSMDLYERMIYANFFTDDENVRGNPQVAIPERKIELLNG